MVVASWSNERVSSVVVKSVIMGLEFEYSRHNRSKGIVLYFGESQQGFTLAFSMLALEVWCIAFVDACS